MSKTFLFLKIQNLLKPFLVFSLTLGLIISGSLGAQAQLSDAERARLTQQLLQIEAEIVETQEELNQTRQQTASYERDRAVLQGEIREAQLNIEHRNLNIQRLSGQITLREQAILELEARLERQKELLAETLRQTNFIDEQTMVEMVLSNSNLSEFFQDYDRFQEVKLQLQVAMNDVRDIRDFASEEREALGLQQNEELDARATIEQQRRVIEVREAEQRALIAANQDLEQSYEEYIAERQREANAIRSALFELRDTGAIPFGTALEYSEAASRVTGVSPALILAILQQESNMGANVGTCNRPGDSRTWRDIMPGPGQSWRDDQAAFMRITQSLGISPDGQPLSCPLASGGWGGAMGPSQFIPTTWEEYASRIASAVGATVANPWNAYHAIHATAIYIQALGGSSTSYTAQREAACRYYSGQGCGQASLPNTFYGDGVMQRAETIQVCHIDPIRSNSVRPAWCPAI